MKLHASLAPLIVAVFFLLSMIGLGVSERPNFLAEYNAPIYMPQASTDLSALPTGAYGDASLAMDLPRDSVREGAWDIKILKIASTDTTSGLSALEVLRDSVPLYHDDHYVFVLVMADGRQPFAGGTGLCLKNTYVAGQTAQGGGMHIITGGTFRISDDGACVPANVLWRYITNSNINNYTLPEFGENILIDHTTGRWGSTSGGQMNLKVGGDSSAAGNSGLFARKVTIQYPLMYEPQSAHFTNASTGAQPRDAPAAAQITWYRYAILGGGSRNPMCSADTTSNIQGITYNWRIRAAEVNNQAICNFIGLMFHTGPATQTGTDKQMPFVFGDECSTPIAGASDSICTRQVYVARIWYLADIGNADTLLPTDTRDYWETTVDGDSIIICRNDYAGPGFVNTKPASQSCVATGGKAPSGWKSASQIVHESWDTPPDTMGLDSATVEEILAEVGNSQRLQCAGGWASRRDAYDSARVAWFRNNWLDLGGETGPITLQSVLGGGDMSWLGVYLPGNPAGLGGDTLTTAEMSPASGTACTDSDDDGLFDLWEMAVHGDLSLEPDSVTSSGYLAIELMLDGITDLEWSEGVSPTFYNGAESVWVRRIAMVDSVPFAGSTDTFPIPYPASDIPPGTGIMYPDSDAVTQRGLHFTCTQSAEGAAVLDSTTFVDDSAEVITGIAAATLMARSPPGCD